MCLTKVLETYGNPSTLITDGWKTFRQSGKKLEFETFSLDGNSSSTPGLSREIPMDKWIKAAVIQVKAMDMNYYSSGFHVYTDEKSKAYESTPRRRVYIRKVKVKGMQDGEECLIADEMYVPSDPNGWPPKNGETKSSTSGGNKAKALELIDKLKDAISGGNA